MRAHHSVKGPLRRELVVGRLDLVTGQLREGLRDPVTKAGGRIEAGTYGGTPHRPLQQTFRNAFELRDTVVERTDIPRPLLTDRQRRGVFEMRAADLYDLVPR